MIKERPILFSAPMVNAILSGSKTQSRRVIKLKLNGDGDYLHAGNHELAHKQIVEFREQDGKWFGLSGYTTLARAVFPYGNVGDRLWVRETWRTDDSLDDKAPNQFSGWPVKYDADCNVLQHGAFFGNTNGKTRVSIHMPRWASRIGLEITGIRVERLHDISEADAIAEGIEQVGGEFSVNPWRNYRKGEHGEMDMHCSCARRSYMTLWESINGKESWEANPWVWAIEFKKFETR